MSYKLIKDYVPKSKYSIKCPYYMKPIGITVHNTANDAPAKNEVAYMKNNNNQTSFHVAIDDAEVIQTIPFNRNAWHAGDGGAGKGNRKTIGIEICYSRSGGAKFDKAEENATAYIAKLLKEYGWTTKKVYRHYDWSGKDCPHRTMDKGWKRFLNMIQAELDKLNGKATASSAKAVNEKVAVDGIWGKATTRATQKVLKTAVDGIVSNQLVSCKKYLPAVSETSWDFKTQNYKGGSGMVKAIQKLVGAKADGFCGKNTVTAMQKFLKNKKFYTGAVNGKMTKATVKAWQKYINSRV